MKKITSRIIAIALALVMVFSFSGCSIMGAEFSDLMDFVINGWDGIYEEPEEGEKYVYPNPLVRTNEIRENHRVTTVNNKVTENHKVTTVNNVVGSKSTASTGVAKTDVPN